MLEFLTNLSMPMITSRTTTESTAQLAGARNFVSFDGGLSRCAPWLLVLACLIVVAGCTSEQDYPDNGSLKVSEERLEFLVSRDSKPTDQERYGAFDVQSKDGNLVNWEAKSDDAWIQITVVEGQNTGEIDQIGVGIDPQKLTPGTHRGTITVTENVDSDPQSRQVVVIVRICGGPCIYVDPEKVSHEVSPLLFGSQSEYLSTGTGVWDSIITDDCLDPDIPVGGPHLGQLLEFQQLGVGFLRYPSGIPSDFFQWQEAVGPITSRTPQINPWHSTVDDIIIECPVYGPDEFLQFADALDAPFMITTNAASGTAQQAADWLTYYEIKGVEAKHWEVGNEIYIEGVDYLFTAHMESEEYAATFDAHARALRAVNPDVKVGAVMAPMDQVWTRAVLTAIEEPIDFVTLHSFQPQLDTCLEPSDDIVYRSLMASPVLVQVQIEIIRNIAKTLKVEANRTLNYSINEWGPWFLHNCVTDDVPDNPARARTQASVVFSALIFNQLMREKDVVSALHSSLSALKAQALLNFFPSGGTFVGVRSGFYYLQKLYIDSIGGVSIPTTMRKSPTFTAKLFDDDIIPIELPVLDSIAVASKDGSKLYVYVVNRGLYDAVDYQLFLGDLPYPIESIVADTLGAANFTDTNTLADPNAILLVNTVLDADDELNLNLPAHTMVRVTVSLDN
jgi:alpha-L-arabinofuranosidase